MKRRHFIESGLGLACGAVCVSPITKALGKPPGSADQLTNPLCRDRVFPQSLGALGHYKRYLRTLKKLLERLGHDNTMTIWQTAFKDYEDPLLAEILSREWHNNNADQVDYSDEIIDQYLNTYFSAPVEGLTPQEARDMAESTPPITQMRQKFPSLNVWRDITAYDSFHLRFHGTALLVEAMIKLHKKEGELIAYDLFRESALEGATQMEVSEFMTSIEPSLNPVKPTRFSAGLDVEFLHTSERELIFQVKECEWARYFQGRHPKVGYLMACSVDETVDRAANEKIRMQRTSTIMEGGKVCHFRYFAV